MTRLSLKVKGVFCADEYFMRHYCLMRYELVLFLLASMCSCVEGSSWLPNSGFRGQWHLSFSGLLCGPLSNQSPGHNSLFPGGKYADFVRVLFYNDEPL